MRRSEEAIRTFGSWLERVTGTGEARAARRAARSWRRGGLGLIILCLLVYIPGLWTIPPVDRDESRFAQASRQMLESGTLEGWVVPRVQDKPRLNKPPLIYWLQAGSAAVLGDAPGQWAWLDGGSENIWVYRVPSLLSAIAAVLLTWRLGVRMFDPRAAWLGAALLAVCPMVVWDAHQARADQVLLATTTATMLALWVLWKGSQRGTAARRKSSNPPSVSQCLRERSLVWSVAFWLCLSLGIMTKGPITPMIAALTCLALSLVSRDWRWLKRLRPVVGAVIIAGVVGPWVYLVGEEVGWSKYLSIVYDETIGRSAGAKEGHWGPPGYHIVLLGVLFWPGSLLTAAAIGRAWRRGLRTAAPAGGGGGAVAASSPKPARLRSRLVRVWHSLRDARPSRPAELFLLAWMLPSWIVFELISTKLPHYTMPLYPAVALMSARALFGVRAMFLPALTGTQRRRLAEFLATRDMKCPRCGYNVRGLTIANCPECNTELRVTTSRRLTAGYATDRTQRLGRTIWIVIGIAIGVCAPLAIVLWNITTEHDIPLRWDALFVVGGGACIVACALFMNLSVELLRANSLVMATMAAICVNIIALGSTFTFLLPRSEDLWLSRRIVQVLRHHVWTPATPLRASGYAEDSLVFLTRGCLTKIDERERRDLRLMPQRAVDINAVEDLSQIPVVTTSSWSRVRWEEWARLKGFNYSTGKTVSVIIGEISR